MDKSDKRFLLGLVEAIRMEIRATNTNLTDSKREAAMMAGNEMMSIIRKEIEK